MTQTIISVAAFLVLLALLPLGIRWLQRRAPGAASSPVAATKIISAVGVGPQQKVVTVEVGPDGARTWLVLGVSAQGISCLHSVSVNRTDDKATTSAAEALTTP